MTTWWVHPVGESDLMLDSRFHLGRDGFPAPPAEDRRKKQDETNGKRKKDIEVSLEALQDVLDAGDRTRLGGLVLDGTWEGIPGRSHTLRGTNGEDPEGRGAIPPITAVLSALADDPSNGPGTVNLVLLGTRQPQGHPLDTYRVAGVLADALKRCATARFPVLGEIRTRIAGGMGESEVLDALRPALPGVRTPGGRGIVTAGSGATSLLMGSATAIVQHGLPLRFAQVSPTGAARWVDPVDRHDVDPIVSQFIRWRLFQPLEEFLGKADAQGCPVSTEERDEIRELARSQAAGYRATSAEDLRMLVADAIVRRDGTAGLTVRRYVESRYAEMLEHDRENVARERPAGPEPVDLWAYGRNGGPDRQPNGHGRKRGRGRTRTLGRIRGSVKKALEGGEHPQNRELPSTTWLLGDAVDALNEIGKASSHELRAPDPGWVRALVDAERGLLVPPEGGDLASGQGHRAEASVGRLPVAPRSPRMRASVIYLVGCAQQGETRPSVGRRILDGGLGQGVLSHLDLDGENSTGRVDLTVLMFHTPQSGDEARRQEEGLGTGSCKGIGEVDPVLCELPWNDDPGARRSRDLAPGEALLLQERIAEHLREHLPEETGAVVLVPPGNKQLLLPLTQVLRRVTTFRGIPLFLREMGRGSTGDHLWPALTGGNLPLLVAARHAIGTLELDVAWRLLAACGGCEELEDRCHRLATAFTCRAAGDATRWPAADAPAGGVVPAGGTGTLTGRALGLVGDRLRLLRESLRRAIDEGSTARDPDRVLAQKVRHLVLAAAVVEKSFSRSRPDLTGQDAKNGYNGWRCRTIQNADDPREADAATVLAVVNQARNDAPITHGRSQDPDALVEGIARKRLTSATGPRPLTTGITGVTGLVDAAVRASGIVWGDRDPTVPDLPAYWHDLLRDLERRIQDTR